MRDRLAALRRTPLAGGLELREAERLGERRRGLAGLDGLPPGVGLRIAGCRSVHTFGMRFALDLVWLDAAEAVVRVDEAVAPRRLRSCRRARSVVEVPAGAGRAFATALDSAILTKSQRSAH